MNIFGKVAGGLGNLVGRGGKDSDDEDSEANPEIREHLIPDHLGPEQSRN